MDMRLQTDVELTDLPRRLKEALPAGITILGVQGVDEAEPALQTQVQAAEYEVTLIEPLDRSELQHRIDRLLHTASVPRERRGKAYDLRPLIEELSLLQNGQIESEVKLFMRLAARESATGRPEEVLNELGIAANDSHIERSRLIFQR